jgi:hypothetical protein
MRKLLFLERLSFSIHSALISSVIIFVGGEKRHKDEKKIRRKEKI